MRKYGTFEYQMDECYLEESLMDDEMTEEEAQEAVLENYNNIEDKSERVHLLKSLWQKEAYKDTLYQKFNFKKEFEKFAPEELIVLPTEKKFYDSLPMTLTVYRGGSKEDNMSWTTNRRVALSFTKDNDDTDIYERTINKSDIHAVINFENDEYNESEIILVN